MGENAAAAAQTQTPAESTAVVSVADEAGVMKMVRKYSLWAGGAGLIPLPALDIVAVSGIQAKMLKELADAYHVDFSQELVKVSIGALVGGVMPTQLGRGIVGGLIKSIPVVGQAVGGLTVAIFSAASTFAVGKVFVQHFASGGTFLDFDPAAVRDYYKEQFAEGAKLASEATAGETPAGTAAETAPGTAGKKSRS